MKYLIITYGCQMNKSDSERIATVLEKMGYKSASKINEADLIVVNMCSVRQSAVDRVYGLMPKFEKFKAQNPNLKTILTGCILKKDRGIFAKGFGQILRLQDLLKYQPKYQNNFSAFIPISNGCNNFCSYCVIPFTRGHLVCRDHNEVLQEVKNAIENGFKEIWLLGQNINDYQSKIKNQKSKVKTTTQNSKLVNFSKLLRIVNDIPGNFWIRFTSSNPKNFSDELIETMAKCQKVTPYLNLPVQSGDNEALKRMNRSYTVLQYKNLIKKIRNAFKKYRKGLESEVAISTDIIVGFPGETREQFENTAKLFKEIKYDMAYVAQYSLRPGTVAAKFKDDVPQKEKERRYKILTKILKETALKKNKKYIEKKVKVLVNEEKGSFFFAKTRTYKTVKFQIPNTRHQILNTNLVGQFVKVKIINVNPFGLKGELIS